MTHIPTLPLHDGGEIPAWGLGTSGHRGRDAANLFTQAIVDGHRLIDTAAQYGNEAAVGVAIKESQIDRDELFITTKIAGGDQGDATERGLTESLRRLDLDRVDLTLIHWPNPSRGLYLRTWEELIRLKDEGFTTHIGVSNFTPEQMTELHEATGVWPVLNQIQLSPIIGREASREFHAQHGIITEGWRPLGPVEGLLDQVLVQNIAAEVERSAAQVVLRWAVQRDIVPIAVSSQPERNAENLAIHDFVLSDRQLMLLDSLDTGNRFIWDPLTHEEW